MDKYPTHSWPIATPILESREDENESPIGPIRPQTKFSWDPYDKMNYRYIYHKP